jgi:outer membrane receptor for ferrienterochelin and colicins
MKRILTFMIFLATLCLISMPLFAAGMAAEDPAKAPGSQLDSLDLESLFNLKVTTASKFPQRLADAPGVLSVVSRDELRRFWGMTLREVLERVPGLAGTTAYFTDRSLIAARGDQTKINGGHILYLINGRPTREVLEGGVVSDLLESFPVNALERIEVIKGPGSVLYGSNAFSAVVNLITRKENTSGVTVNASGGKDGASATSLTGSFNKGAMRFMAAGQFHQRPSWKTTYRVPFVDPLFPETSSIAAQEVPVADRGTGAYVEAGYKGLTVMSSFTEWHGSSFVRGAVGENRWRRGFGDVGYALQASSIWNMNFNVTYSRTTLAVPSFPFIGRDSNEIVAEWTNTISPTPNDQLTFGTLYSLSRGREAYYGITPGITISEGRRSGVAAYGQLDHRLSDHVKVIGGFQANKIDSIRLSVVPRGGVIWSPTKRISVKGLFAKAFRAPSINETGLNHPGLEGTPGLKPEKVGTFDLQLAYQGNRFQAAVSYFISKQTDSIVVDSKPARWKYRNLGEATFHGVEFEEKYYLSKNFFLSGSVLYQMNHDGNNKNNITPLANFGAKAGFSYESDGGFTASLFDVYQGHIAHTNSTNPHPSAYHLLNSYVRFDVSKYVKADAAKNLSVFIKGENLANRQIWLPDWGSNFGDTIPVNRGRAVYFGFEVSLTRE